MKTANKIRKIGSGKPKGIKQGPSKGSWNEWLSTFDEDERRYVETTLYDYSVKMRTILNPVHIKQHEILDSMKFNACLLTAVGFTAGDIRYLLCIERTK